MRLFLLNLRVWRRCQLTCICQNPLVSSCSQSAEGTRCCGCSVCYLQLAFEQDTQIPSARWVVFLHSGGSSNVYPGKKVAVGNVCRLLCTSRLVCQVFDFGTGAFTVLILVIALVCCQKLVVLKNIAWILVETSKTVKSAKLLVVKQPNTHKTIQGPCLYFTLPVLFSLSL